MQFCMQTRGLMETFTLFQVGVISSILLSLIGLVQISKVTGKIITLSGLLYLVGTVCLFSFKWVFFGVIIYVIATFGALYPLFLHE